MSLMHFRLSTAHEPARADEPAAPRTTPRAEPVVTFDMERIEASRASGFVQVPSGLSREARRQFIREIASQTR